MELRDIEIFLVLAEELHFGRTAERLHLSPARISQSVKKQERRIGAPLFERSSRQVALTPVGEQLHRELRPVHRALQEVLDRAALAARGRTGVLRVGMIGGGIVHDLRPLLDAFSSRRPGCEVRFRSIGFNDPFGHLRSGEIDVAILWLPVRESDLTVGPVAFTESVVLAVAASHPLAGEESVSYEDLAGETVVDAVAPVYWREAVIPARTPGGRPIRLGPPVRDVLELIPIVASGEAVSPVHAQTARYFPRPDIAYIPVRDAPLARWALVWRTAQQSAPARDFARSVEEHGPLAL